MSCMQEHIRNALQKQLGNDRPLTRYRFLLAVSGGVDSMVMAHLFLELGLPFGIAHFNFQLRGEESDQDAALVEEFCRRHDLPFHLKSENTYQKAEELRRSIQETARHLRYQFFEEIRAEFRYDFVSTAHHAHDQLETFFIHLLRGSGLKGLTGIPPRRGFIIRPMLEIPLSTIERYARDHQVEYREDLSNRSDDYLRNKIRHHITEPLISWDDSVLTNAMKSMEFVSEAQEFIDGQIKEFCKMFVHDPVPGIRWFDFGSPGILSASHRFLLKEFLRDSGLYTDSIDNLLTDPLHHRTGSRFEGQETDAYFDRGKVWLVRKDLFPSHEVHQEMDSGTMIRSEDGDMIYLGEEDRASEFGGRSVKIDPEKISFPLVVRRWQSGDVVWQGKTSFFRKSVKKILSESRIPLPFKERVRILADAQGQILSVLGFADNTKIRISEEEEGLWLGYQSDFWQKIKPVLE